MKRAGWRRFLILPGAGLALVAAMVLIPTMRKPFGHRTPGPPPTYEQAMAELRAMLAEPLPEVSPEGRPVLLEHGYQTERVFVLLHGLSNAPRQFSALGRQLFERGHNVLIPRLPYHGEKDRMTESWAKLSAEQMLESANRATDLARGLGKKVTVAGLSINGTVVAWMGQNRSDLDQAVLMAPFLAPAGTPGWMVAPMQRAMLRLPNFFFWWNPVLKEKNPGPPYAYPRFPTRVIGETMFLGVEVLGQSKREAPKSPSILVITTASDLAASNAQTASLVANWRAHRPAGIETFEFPKSDKVGHDFIDPHQPDQRVDFVYPKLMEMLEKGGSN